VVVIGTGQMRFPVLAWRWRDWAKCEMPQNCGRQTEKGDAA